MLMLSRKSGQGILLYCPGLLHPIEINVRLKGNGMVTVGIEAPANVLILRTEKRVVSQQEPLVTPEKTFQDAPESNGRGGGKG